MTHAEDCACSDCERDALAYLVGTTIAMHVHDAVIDLTEHEADRLIWWVATQERVMA